MINIFWGYFLVFFHLKINGFDLLPNLFGYILIAYGLSTLIKDSDYFKKGYYWAIGLFLSNLVLSLFTFMGVGHYYPIIITVLSFLSLFINLYVIYLIIQGIRDLEQKKHLNLFYNNLMKVWYVQIICNIGSSLLLFMNNGITYIFLFLFILIGFMANIIFLVYLYKTHKLYK